MMLARKIDTSHTLVKTAHFPYNSPKSRCNAGAHKVLLGIGGNVGDVLRRFEHLFWYLQRSAFVHICKTAPVLKNPPFGYANQNDFYNSVMLIETRLTPRALLRYVFKVEKHFGRTRLFKNGPRTLDIDIIFYDDVQIHTKDLILPHPKWKQRPSVLIPLRYLQSKETRKRPLV